MPPEQRRSEDRSTCPPNCGTLQALGAMQRPHRGHGTKRPRAWLDGLPGRRFPPVWVQIMRYRELVLAGVFALAGMAAPASAHILITIDKSNQRMTVAVNGEPRWNWRVSTGRPGRDTPSGKFQAFRMEADHFSKEFDDAPMPHSIFFTN